MEINTEKSAEICNLLTVSNLIKSSFTRMQNTSVSIKASSELQFSAEHPFTGPEPVCGISMEVAKKAIKD
jgi:hypothetical protein